MAETSSLVRRVDARLQAVMQRVAALSEYARRDDLDRVALDAEWRDALDRIVWLDEHFHREGFTTEQSRQFRHLLELLAGHAALVQQLGLQSPPAHLVSQEDHAVGTASLADSA